MDRIWRIPAAIICFALAIIIGTNISPIFDFSDPKPFSGAFIYNPYEGNDGIWEKATFHTHTKVDNLLNECEMYPDSTLALYESFGYKVVSFSNHMQLTDFPGAKSREIRVYEHGINFCKLHNLVFNPTKVNWFDSFLPITASQQQFKIDRLSKNADFVALNHPDRTNFITTESMKKLSGYRTVEADCGFYDEYTYGEKWDAALSAGHYAPSAISDDLHHPGRSVKFARRCCFLGTTSQKYEDVKAVLLSGDFYSMHIPDFGDGDWNVKREAHFNLPSVSSVGLKDSLAYMTVSRPAKSLEVIGDGGEILKSVADSISVDYAFRPENTYVRMVARFDDGCVIFSNPFARWDGVSETPYSSSPHPIKIILTILWNLMVLLISGFFVYTGILALRRSK